MRPPPPPKYPTILYTLTLTLASLFPLLAQEHTEIVYAFRNFSRAAPLRLILVGEIRSKIKVAEVFDADSPFLGVDMRLDQVTVKVLNRGGLKIGQKLYVIEKNPHHKQYRNGLIVGEIQVTSIFNNPIYGWSLTGTGILLRVREGQFIARTLDSENLERAHVLKKKGDHHWFRGDTQSALSNYQASLEADSALPEAHFAMGRIYFDLAQKRGREIPIRTLAEYQLAWESQENFRYIYERFNFYQQYMTALFRAYDLRRLEASREDRTIRYLDQILTIAAQAQKIHPNHNAILWQLCRAQYHRMNYNNTRSTAQERTNYTTAREKTGQLLEQLLQETTKNTMPRIALLYYAHIYKEPLTVRPDPEQQARLKQLILHLAEAHHLNQDPLIEELLQDLREETN